MINYLNQQQLQRRLASPIIPANISLHDSVGLGGRNLVQDVRLIQGLLNQHQIHVPITGAIRGEYDITVLAIFHFQKKNEQPYTGKIEKDDATFRLLKNHSTQSPANNQAESDPESLHAPYFTNRFNFRRRANDANTLNIIFEGDSWFDYPIPGVQDLYDTITGISSTHRINSLHLAKFGETTNDMINDKDRFLENMRAVRVDRVFFSGGGNDIFPQLGRIVKRNVLTFNDNFFTNAEKLAEIKNTPYGDERWKKCIAYKQYLNTSVFDNAVLNNSFLATAFLRIKNNFLEFGDIVNSTTQNNPNFKFYMHTYDYPIFSIGRRPHAAGINLPLGPWIEPVFQNYQINDDLLRTFIIIRLMDRFYHLLRSTKQVLDSRYSFRTEILDFRGVMNSSRYWRDEIHPNSDGARRLATRVRL